MYNIKCKVCGNGVTYDPHRTLTHYKEELSRMKIEVPNMEPFPYLIYFCHSCNLSYKYTFKEVETMERERLTKLAQTQLDKKGASLLPRVNTNAYCGMCAGIDGKGNCYDGIMQTCTVRARKVRFNK